MPREQEIEDKLDELAGYAEKLGHEVDKVEEEIDGEKIRGIVCSTGAHHYQIVASVSRDIDYFEVSYPFDLQQIIARELKRRNEGEEVEIDPDEDEDYMKEARKKLVGLTNSQYKKVQVGLIERITTTEASYEIETINDFGVRGFSVQKKIFPFEEDFGIKELNAAARTVMFKGILGGVFLGHSYEVMDFLEGRLETDEENNEDSEIGYIG